MLMGAAVLAGSSVGVFYALKPTEMDRLRQQNMALLREREQLREWVERLTLETRVAEARVLDQIHEGDLVNGQRADKTMTSIEFVEFDRQQSPLPARRFLIEGELVYFESLVLKFEYEDVAAGDVLKGKSLLLFRRIFGEHQNPVDGYQIDPEHEIPDVYRVDANPSEVERKLWSRFWDYMADPVLRDHDGVRIAQVQAPAVKMKRGQVWVLKHQSTGDLNLELRTPSPEDVRETPDSRSVQGNS